MFRPPSQTRGYREVLRILRSGDIRMSSNRNTSSSSWSLSSSSFSSKSQSYSSSSSSPSSDFSSGFHRYFGFGLSVLTLYAFNLAVDDLILYEKAKAVAMPKLKKSKRVSSIVSSKDKKEEDVRLEADFWYNGSCNKRGENVRVIAFIVDGDKASCDVKVTMMRKFQHKGRLNEKEEEEEGTTGNENDVRAPRAKPYQSAWLRSPLKYLPESVKNSIAMDQIWEIVEVSATLPNEQGMGVPGQVDLLKKEKQWKHGSSKKN